MGKVIFHPFRYWNKDTMTVTQEPTPEQDEKVKKVSDYLNAKYIGEKGCNLHPEQTQKLLVYLHNGKVDIKIADYESCTCRVMVDHLYKIINHEELMLNNDGVDRK